MGAYTDGRGGVCPMLGAHRRGGRNDLASFARAWDRYTGAGKRPREAAPRELRTLRAMLEASLTAEEMGGRAFVQAVREHEAVKARRAAAERLKSPNGKHPRRSGERDRFEELRQVPGWAWLRVFRRYDDFQAAVDRAGRPGRADRPLEQELVG